MKIADNSVLRMLGFAVAVMSIVWAGSVSPSMAQMTEASNTKDLALRGDAVCTRCHDETEAYPVLAIGKTKHGTVADSRTPTCTSCHGESPTHVNKPANVKERPKPDRYFGKKAPFSAGDKNKACLGCHEGSKRMLWAGSPHDTNDVACTSCHQIHTDHDKVRSKSTQTEVCFTCHKQQRIEVSKISRHPILEGKVVCSDCHNPHGSAGPKLMARDTVNDTCFQCHAEKRGPFLWPHQPVTEDCGYCHNPHGSTVASLLKWRAPFLCHQCHEPASHRGALPVIGGNGTNEALGRACVNCHTNIHGGSHPTNSSASRSFRR